jgi:hypothetical protein
MRRCVMYMVVSTTELVVHDRCARVWCVKTTRWQASSRPPQCHVWQLMGVLCAA